MNYSDIKQQIIDPEYQNIRGAIDYKIHELDDMMAFYINELNQISKKELTIKYSLETWLFNITDIVFNEKVEFSSKSFEQTFNIWRVIVDKWTSKIRKEILDLEKKIDKLDELFKNLENELTISIDINDVKPTMNYIVSKKYKSIFESIDLKTDENVW